MQADRRLRIQTLLGLSVSVAGPRKHVVMVVVQNIRRIMETLRGHSQQSFTILGDIKKKVAEFVVESFHSSVLVAAFWSPSAVLSPASQL